MKLGTENKKETIAAAALFLLALFLLVRMFSAPSTSVASPAAPPPKPSSAATRNSGTNASDTKTQRRGNEKVISMTLKPTLDPRLRLDLLKSSEEVKYEGTGRNIFQEQSAPPIPQPVVNPRKDAAAQQQAQGPPPPPPINLKFFGYASRTGERRRIFLAQGDSVFAAHEGDIIAGRYRIVRINPTSVEVQDVLNNNTQTIPMIRG